MTTVTRIEKRQRGFFGWIFLIVFWLFQLLMVAWLIAGIGAVSEQQATLTSDAERAGAAIGSMIGFSMIVGFWVAGTIILGAFVLLTRGKKMIIEKS